ncbi:Broad-range acid phosphatase DET1 [Cytospora mali]|uniref:Broad-range acid phosphatase DET1 n=1 Tax=Cytospora mali TaxID=578113 RepID=A0A194VSM6_CYTMA|nr:Broad-range acid phosphatase DET1 [Valsa mali]
MAKPRLIILIRHAQSEGNKNREIHQTIPDHRVKLTQDGWQQAYDAGRRLRNLLRADDTVQFFTSPYRRTRETTEGILATLTSDEPGPSPFKRNNIKVYEEPRLREQDFGNFQPCSAEMERMWQERADYGHFFYRIPNGESAADAYDRVSGFNESLWRQFGDDDFASVCVLVTHGLMSRVFLMKWYHFSVEYFEDLRNINHCEFLIMTKQESGKYVLDTKLRTWSELRRERALKQKEKDKEKSSTDVATMKDKSKLDRAVSAESPSKPRRWGGCPDGCDHNKSFRIHSALADLVKLDESSGHSHHSVVHSPNMTASAASLSSSMTTHDFATPPTTHGASTPTSTLGSRRPAPRRFQSEDDDDFSASEYNTQTSQIDVIKARQEAVSSSDGTPSFISAEDRLRARDGKIPLPIPSLFCARGRDFGGTLSGRTSRDQSDADSSEDERSRQLKRSELGMTVVTSKTAGMDLNDPGNGGSSAGGAPLSGKRDRSGMGRGTMANRLGDSPSSSEGNAYCGHDHDSQGENEQADDEREMKGNEDIDEADELSDIDRAEREDRSINGSVY